MCIANVLDHYANELTFVGRSLPPRVQTLSSVVGQAAGGVRDAHSKAEAIHALQLATASVNKTIALLKAEDPNALTLGAEVGRSVDETFGVAQQKLLRSSEL